MEIAKIFSELSSHLVEGLMLHDQLCSIYLYLGLEGYAECHKYQLLAESVNYRKLQDFFVTRYERMIPESKVTNPQLVDDSFFERRDLSPENVKKHIMYALKTWIEWEETSKDLFEKMWTDCIELGEVNAAEFIMALIHDVDSELVRAKSHEAKKIMTDFDLVEIAGEQKSWEKEYKKNLTHIL